MEYIPHDQACTLCCGTRELDCWYMNGKQYKGPCTGCGGKGTREAQEDVSNRLRLGARYGYDGIG